MKLKHLHIIGIGLLLCGLLGFASCRHESFEPLLAEEEDNDIYLTFHTAVAGVPTRGTGGSLEADEERKQLLVVIVSEKGSGWEVEWYRPIGNASIGIPLYDEYTFKVKTGCKKRIYLVANYKGLVDKDGKPLDFGVASFMPDKDGSAQVDKFVFALKDGVYGYSPDTYGIPMTAMYELTVPPKEELSEEEYELQEKLYMVRAATKYSFSFANRSTRRNVKVTGVDVEKVITDRMFLMPHVNKGQDTKDGGKEKYWVVSGDSVRYLPIDQSGSWFANREWIDWMEKEAGKTGDNETQPDADEEWLTDYKVPKSGTGTSGDGTTSYTMEFTADVPASTAVESPVVVPKSFYLPESCSRIDDDAQLKQAYTLTVHTEETFVEGGVAEKDSRVTSYTTTLPHLASLFRNTHVKVNITFNDYTLDWAVDVEPYWAVELEPEFGL